MKWNEVKADIGARPLEECLKGLGIFDAIQLVHATQDEPHIFIDCGVEEKIRRHLSTKRIELGGLLLGTVYSRRDLVSGIALILITDSVQSDDYLATGASLEMSPSVWEKARARSDAEQFVVGWYHSHPNLGAFFSGTDRRTQSQFFTNPYSIGLVVDPIRNEAAWFLGRDSLDIKPNRVHYVR